MLTVDDLPALLIDVAGFVEQLGPEDRERVRADPEALSAIERACRGLHALHSAPEPEPSAPRPRVPIEFAPSGRPRRYAEAERPAAVAHWDPRAWQPRRWGPARYVPRT